MYLAYWGLSQSPFRGNLDPRYFQQGPAQDEALARLDFLVEQRRTLGLLLGGPGSGKSLLLEFFARELGVVNRQPAVVSLVGIGRREFLWLLGGQLGTETLSSAGEFALGRAVEDHIIANRHQQIATILLLDDADEAAREVLDEIARLARLNQISDARLTMVLAARGRQLHKLGTRILELAELRVDLVGWDQDDTAAFVKKSLAAAGRSTPIFSESALRRLHELTGGVPRRVKQLADLALLGGAGANLAHLESDLIDAVFDELGVVTTDSPVGAAAG
ncbi:MAG: AAA family ATPase [Pirellulales bacterium]